MPYISGMVWGLEVEVEAGARVWRAGQRRMAVLRESRVAVRGSDTCGVILSWQNKWQAQGNTVEHLRKKGRDTRSTDN